MTPPPLVRFLTGLVLGVAGMVLAAPERRQALARRIRDLRRAPRTPAPPEWLSGSAANLPPPARARLAPRSRAAAGVAAATLLGWAAIRRDRRAGLLGAVGAGLAARGISGRPLRPDRVRDRGVALRARVEVAAGAHDVYSFWVDLSQLGRLLSHLERVDALGGDRFRFIARGPGGLGWDVVIVRREPGRLVTWRSEEGAPVALRGGARIMPTGPASTGVEVWLAYTPAAPAAGRVLRSWLGRRPEQAFVRDVAGLPALLGSPAGQPGPRGAGLDAALAAEATF